MNRAKDAAMLRANAYMLDLMEPDAMSRGKKSRDAMSRAKDARMLCANAKDAYMLRGNAKML